MKLKISRYYFVILVIIRISFTSSHVQANSFQKNYDKVFNKIDSLFNKSKIPGLSIALVSEDSVCIKNFGYADSKNKKPVNSKTLFELGSTSKAFTALAILYLEKQKLICLEDYVCKYIPWFKTYYKDKEIKVKLKDLLHHTSGIPWETISEIPEGNDQDMLERTVLMVNKTRLKNLPGDKYEYATINYDILGLIIEKVSKLSFEEYLFKNIFIPLKLNNTSVGAPMNDNFAKGYKISFFSPLEYNAPSFRGNNPAGYVITNIEDISKWLKYQLSIDTNEFQDLILHSHSPNLSVRPQGLLSYASGWLVEPYGETRIFHYGLNPNYTSFVGFYPEKKIGVAILANSNSGYTAYFGNLVMKILNNEELSEVVEPEDDLDKGFTIISIILSVFILGIAIIFIWIVKGIIKKERTMKKISKGDISIILGSLLLTIPFIIGIYLLPRTIANFSWNAAIVWTSNSFLVSSVLFGCSVLGVWFLNTMSMLVPTKNKYFESLPVMIIISIMSGIANMVIILILINAIDSNARIYYLLYFFSLSFAFYILGSRVVQKKLINMSLAIVFEIRMRLINKIFLSSYQKFEKIDNGRVYATLNQDTATISNSVNIFIVLMSNIITIIGVFIYLGTVSLIATLLLATVITIVAFIYYKVSNNAKILFEQVRDSANIYSGLIDGLLYGYKELSLSNTKKREYTSEIENSCLELKNKSNIANLKFINAFFVGESLLIMVLGTISFIIPFLFHQIPSYKLIGIIMLVLYLIGPINGVLNSIPSVIQIKVSWNRVNKFIEDIEPDLNLIDVIKENKEEAYVDKLSIKELVFEYKKEEQDEENFKVGPINLEINKGEILFIIGGNGSGKSTLANLLTGLYNPDNGTIEVNGRKIGSKELGGLYSAIFSNNHIFKKIYGINVAERKQEIEYLLKLFRLENKVSIDNDQFSTINLSNGQRKRLSLMKCFLENSPLYLFDEWAADQDPEYKKIFYRKLLPEMKRKGKIVIAITHDDNYFDVADKIVKMDMGKLVDYRKNIDKSNVPEYL